MTLTLSPVLSRCELDRIHDRPGYCNPDMDELVFAYVTTPDPEEAMGYMFEAQAIFNQDRPLLILAGRASCRHIGTTGSLSRTIPVARETACGAILPSSRWK